MSDKQSSFDLPFSRRDFLRLSLAGAVAAAAGCAGRNGEPSIGLALGGGGAKGLAHILVLEALDELGIRPRLIAGTSIGAIIGAAYAAGLSGKDIRAQVEQFFADKDKDSFFPLPASIRWLDFIDPAFAGGGLLDSSDFIDWLGEVLPTRNFSGLKIPLKIVAADLMTGREVIFESGALLPAIKASMAVPGVFPPVEIKGYTLVDGGLANPLPFDRVQDECDIVIAVDVSGNRELEKDESLSSIGVLLQSFAVMSNNILIEKLKHQMPAVFVQPDIRNVKILEFFKAREVFAQAMPAKAQFIKDINKAKRLHRFGPGCTRR
ncbi:MAG: patatin-like phospholipase family protein [Gammaproteobacteria bacterium]|nr:patatin-like phospholipase family protein [Gammaproteobacteria bacterium]